MKRLLSLAALGVYAVGLAAGLFLSLPAAAIPPPRPIDGMNVVWIDRTHIALEQPATLADPNGTVVAMAVDGRMDFDYHFDLQSGTASNAAGKFCYLTIDFPNVSGDFPKNTAYEGKTFTDSLNTTTADFANRFGIAKITYGLAQGPPTNNCTKTTVTLDSNTAIHDLSNFNITFRWTDINNIQRVDSLNGDGYNPLIFTRNPSGPDGATYHDTSGYYGPKNTVYNYFSNSSDSATCQDFLLEPQSSADNQAGYYEQLGKNSNGDSGPPASDPIVANAGGGCPIYKSYDSGVGNGGLVSYGHITIGGYSAVADQTPCTTAATCQSAGGATGSGSTTASCQIPGGFGWILCPIINASNAFFQKVEAGIVDLLKVPALTAQNYTGAFAVWGALRNLSNVFFVIVFLVIIFSNTLSIGLDNYDIKKMLPRLVAAAILVQFSWVIMQLAVDVSNILGAGIGALVHSVVPTVSNGPSVVANVIGSAITAIGITTVGAVAISLGFLVPFLLAILSLALTILAAVITLELRKLVLVILIVASPLAFMAWVLPNTTSVFKTWSKLLTRLLLMYPLIVFIFAMAAVAQSVTANSGNSDIEKILTAILPTLVFFTVPWTFKWAGGAMAAIGGAVTARTSGWTKAAKQSQAAKDDALHRKEKNAIRANESNNRAARFLGRTVAGGVIPSDARRRRLASEYKKAIGIRGDETEAQINSLGLTGDELTGTLVTLAQGGSSHNITASSGAQRKAIEMLSQKRDYGTLAQLRQDYLGPDGEMDAAHARIWNDGIRSTIGDLATNAPDLIQGNSAFDNISADQIASMHQSTAQRMMQYVIREQTAAQQPGATPDAIAKADHLRDGIYQAFGQVVDSPQMRGRVKRETSLAIKQFSGVFGAQAVQDINQHVDDTGVIH